MHRSLPRHKQDQSQNGCEFCWWSRRAFKDAVLIHTSEQHHEMAPSTLRHDNLKGLTPKIRGVHWLCCRQEQAALIDLSKANKPSAYIMAQLPQIQARHLVSCFDATSVDDCGTLPHSVTSCRLQRASASIYVLSGISDPFGFKSLDIGMIAAIPESVPGIGKLGLRKSPEEMDTHTHTLYEYILSSGAGWSCNFENV